MILIKFLKKRYETVESGGTIISGMNSENIVESVKLATSIPWEVDYEFDNHHSPSSVVVNAIRSQITTFI